MTKPISARVAQILNARDLVINKGMNAGIKEGMQFHILNSRGQNIMDPETGEPLGSVELPKASVQVTKVFEKMSICSTYKLKGGSLTLGFYGGLSSQLLQMTKPSIETLATNIEDKKELDLKNSVVEVGDQAIQVGSIEEAYFDTVEEALSAVKGIYDNEIHSSAEWRPLYIQLDLLSAFEKILLTLINSLSGNPIKLQIENFLEITHEIKRVIRDDAYVHLSGKFSPTKFEELTDFEISMLLRPEKLGGMLFKNETYPQLFKKQVIELYSLLKNEELIS